MKRGIDWADTYVYVTVLTWDQYDPFHDAYFPKIDMLVLDIRSLLKQLYNFSLTLTKENDNTRNADKALHEHIQMS